MAGRKSSRKARTGGKRLSPKKWKPTRPKLSAGERERVVQHLRDLVRFLQQAMSTVIVSVEALRHQNADCDEDVARVLQRNVSDRLYGEVEKTTAFLATLAPKAKAANRGRRA